MLNKFGTIFLCYLNIGTSFKSIFIVLFKLINMQKFLNYIILNFNIKIIKITSSEVKFMKGSMKKFK